MAPKRVIAVTITGDNRQLRRQLRQATREVKSFERAVGGIDRRMRSMRQRIRATGIVGRGGGAIRTAAGFAGIFGFQQMVTEARDLDARLTDIGITGNLSRKQLKELKGEMFAVSRATGIGTMQVLDFVDAVTVQTGNTQAARDALKDIGEVAVATGADLGDLGGVFVKLTANMKLGAKEAGAAFNILRSQEKKGSVTLANVAAQFGKLAGAATPFGKRAEGLRGVQALGGLFQLTARGFGIGQEGEAATSAAAFLRFLGSRTKQIKKTFGVDVLDKEGQVRDLPTVFEELGLAFNRDKAAFRKKGALIFGRAGVKTAFQLSAAAAGPGGFKQAQGKFAAARELFEAGGVNEIAADAAKRRESQAFKFNKAMNAMRIQLQKVALDILPKVTKALPEIGRVLKFVIENSRLLFKLWLGAKGAAFFMRLTAPVGGGVMGATGRAGVMGAGYGVPGVGGFVGRTGRAAAMARAGALAPAMGGGTYLNPVWGGQYVQGFGRGRRSDLQTLRRERGLLRRGGRAVSGAAGTAAGFVGKNAGGLLAVLAMSPFLKDVGIEIGQKLTEYIPALERFRRSRTGVGAGTDRLIARALDISNSRLRGRVAGLGVQTFLKTTERGAVLDRGVEQLFEETLSETARETEFGTEEGLELDIGRLAHRRGKKGGIAGLRTLRGRFASAAQVLRQQAIAGGAKTEEEIMAAAPRLATLEKAASALDNAIARLVRGEGIKVTAVVDLKSGPGRRLERTAGSDPVGEFVGSLGL